MINSVSMHDDGKIALEEHILTREVDVAVATAHSANDELHAKFVQDAASCFDSSLLSHDDRREIGRENAQHIFGL